VGIVQSYRSSFHIHTISCFWNEIFEMMQAHCSSILAELLVYFNLIFESSVDNLPVAKLKAFVENIKLTEGRHYILMKRVDFMR